MGHTPEIPKILRGVYLFLNLCRLQCNRRQFSVLLFPISREASVILTGNRIIWGVGGQVWS